MFSYALIDAMRETFKENKQLILFRTVEAMHQSLNVQVVVIHPNVLNAM